MRVNRPFALGLAIIFFTAPAWGQRIKQGEPFPDFTATNTNTGERFSLSDYRGTVVLIDFWATWCGPCVRELPNVDRAYRKHAHKGFEVISISLDSKRDRFEQFVQSRRMTWPQVMEGGGWKTRLAKKYGISSIPQMFLLDREGNLIGTNLRGRGFEKSVARALAGSPRPAIEPVVREDEPVLSAEAVDDLRAQTQAAAESLRRAAAPLKDQRRSLDLVEGGISQIEAQLPHPRDLAAFQRDYGAMRTEMSTVRANLFAQGLLNGVVVAMPADPYTGDGADPKGPVIGVRRQLPALRQPLARMNLALATSSRNYDAAWTALEEVERGLATGRGDAETMRSRVVDAQGEADRLQAAYRTGWQAQLRGLDGKASKIMDTADGVFADLKPRIRKLQSALADAGSDEGAKNGIRSDFVTLSMDILARFDANTKTSSVTTTRGRRKTQ